MIDGVQSIRFLLKDMYKHHRLLYTCIAINKMAQRLSYGAEWMVHVHYSNLARTDLEQSQVAEEELFR